MSSIKKTHSNLSAHNYDHKIREILYFIPAQSWKSGGSYLAWVSTVPLNNLYAGLALSTG